MEIFRARLWAWETPVDAISSGRPLSGTNILLRASLLAVGGPSWHPLIRQPSQVTSSQVKSIDSRPPLLASGAHLIGCRMVVCCFCVGLTGFVRENSFSLW